MLRLCDLSVAFAPCAASPSSWGLRNAFVRALRVWAEGDNDPALLRSLFASMGRDQALAAAVDLCIPEGDEDACVPLTP